MKKSSPTTSTRLAEKLQQIRLDLQLSQSQILDRLGFADQLFRSNISQYELGNRIPALAVLLAYSRLAGIDLAVLIDDALDLSKAVPGKSKKGSAKRSSKTPTKRKRTQTARRK
jgi:transcriptional regulator with XRE-family HTH domain